MGTALPDRFNRSMTVNHVRRGAGEPLVLLHGIGSRWQCFAPVIDRLAEHHDVIALDLPGFGASPLRSGVEPGPRGYAQWLPGWLAEQGVTRPHVVGNSMGGGIALELGRAGGAASVTAFSPIGFWKRPGVRWTQGVVSAMRLAGGAAGPVIDRALGSPLGRGPLLAPFFGHPTRVEAADARADLAALVGASGFRQARASFAGYTWDPAADSGHLSGIPVTIAWGTRDVLLTHATQSRRAQALLPHARHIDLPGSGHLPFHDDADLCAATILDTTGVRA
jgi:pimeloyl-ACP methyl ester carboxylesterase